MRSLQDWTRYLEQQEQDLQPASKTPEPKIEEAPAPPAPPRQIERPKPVAPTPKIEDEDVPAFLRVGGEQAPVETPRPEPPKRSQPKPAKPVPAPKPEKLTVSPKPTPEPIVGKETIAKAARLRKRLPAGLNTEPIGQREIAGSSYKTFKESREELIQRLVDPILTLEEVARILNVCPTTVRRYTNKGAIAHHRTAGNQRRFRLSDVLAFLEQQSGVVEE